jgi:hypothetical protein
MDQRTERHAAAMAKAGVGLLALPLADLPPIAHVTVRHDRGGVVVELQLAHPVEVASALCTWADAPYRIEAESSGSAPGRLNGDDRLHHWSRYVSVLLQDADACGPYLRVGVTTAGPGRSTPSA